MHIHFYMTVKIVVFRVLISYRLADQHGHIGIRRQCIHWRHQHLPIGTYGFTSQITTILQHEYIHISSDTQRTLCCDALISYTMRILMLEDTLNYAVNSP